MGQIYEKAFKANHSHTCWYNMSPLNPCHVLSAVAPIWKHSCVRYYDFAVNQTMLWTKQTERGKKTLIREEEFSLRGEIKQMCEEKTNTDGRPKREGLRGRCRNTLEEREKRWSQTGSDKEKACGSPLRMTPLIISRRWSSIQPILPPGRERATE